MKKIIPILLLCFFLFSCNMQKDKNIKTVKEYYKVFSERKDINKMLDFYSNNPTWEDGVLNSKIEGKDALKYTFDWGNKNYKKHPDYPETVSITNILGNDSIVVVNGKYNPYYFNGNLNTETPFTTWFYFDKEGKIKKQVEWIQYTLNDLEEMINFKKNARIE